MKQETLKMFRDILDRGDGMECALDLLRDHGFSKIDSIKAITEVTNYSLRQAKIMVHFSRSWNARRQADDEFHDDLLGAIQNAGIQISETVLGPNDRRDVIEALKAIEIEIPLEDGDSIE